MVFGLQKMQDELFCMTEERNYFQGKYMEQISEIADLKDQLSKARREILRLRGELMEGSSTAIFGGGGGMDVSSQQQQQQQQQLDPSHQALLEDESMYQTPQKKNGRRRSRPEEEKKEGDCRRASANDEEDYHSGDEDEGTGEEATQTGTSDNPYNEDDDDDEDEEDDEKSEAADIRQSAEKLLQWASYRTYARSSISATNSPGATSPDQVSLASGVAGVSATAAGSGAGAGNNNNNTSQSIMVPRTIESNTSEASQTTTNDASGGDNGSGPISPSLSQDSGATQPTDNSNNSKDEQEDEE